MRNWMKLAAAAVLAAVTSIAFATIPVTQESVEKAAMTAQPGKVTASKLIKKDNKDVWEVKVKGDDGKDYTLLFDAQTGEEMK